MKGWKRHIILFILLVTGTLNTVNAQDGNPLQFIPEVSQSAWANPSFQNKTDKLVVGLPLLSGARMDWNANFSLDYIFSSHFSYSFDKFYNELGGPGHELGTAMVPVLYLSLRREKQNFTFSVAERIFTESTFDHEFLKFIDNGLLPYYGKTEQYGPMSIHAFHYRELAFAYSRQLWEGLNIGIRPKILFGRLDYNMKEMNINVYTDTPTEQLLIEPSGNYKIAGRFDVSYDAENHATSIRPVPGMASYFFGFQNLGAAVDVGFDYRIDRTEIAAALTDLGFFTMNNDVYEVSYSEVLRYDRDELYQSTDPEGDAFYIEPKIALQNLIDSIPYVISAVPSNQNLTETIPLKVNASVRHHLSSTLDFGVSGQLTFFDDHTRNYLTTFLHTALSQRFHMAASLSLIDFKKLLPGAGLTYTGKNVQTYLSTNNITALFKPTSAKTLNLCFGVNFLFSTE